MQQGLLSSNFCCLIVGCGLSYNYSPYREVQPKRMPATKEKLEQRAVSPNAASSDAERNRALAKACLKGDRGAYAELFDAYGKRVYNFCLRYTCNADDAAEATQEAFCNFLAQLKKLDLDKVQVSGYLFAAARNASLDMVKESGRMEPTEDVPVDGLKPVELEVDPERSSLLDDQSKAVAAANMKLPERHRAVLAMRELEQMSYEQIGKALNVKGNAVAQLLSRARLRLRDEIRNETLMRPIEAEDCKRALPYLSMKVDGNINKSDKQWLSNHLDDCNSCRENLVGIEEAGATYRGWLPVPLMIGFDRVADASAKTLARYAAGKTGSTGFFAGWKSMSFVGKLSLVGSVVCTPIVVSVALMSEAEAPTNSPAPEPTSIKQLSPAVAVGDTSTKAVPKSKATATNDDLDLEATTEDDGSATNSSGDSSSKSTGKRPGSKEDSSGSKKGGSDSSGSDSGSDTSVPLPGGSTGDGSTSPGTGSGSDPGSGSGGDGSSDGPGDCDPTGESESLPPCTPS